MKNELTALVAAIRAQPWAILPEYLEAIEAIAVRALDEDVLARVAADGHEALMAESRAAVAAVGRPLEGAAMSTLRGATAVIPVVGAIFPRASMVGASTGGSALSTIMRDVRVAWASAEVERIVMLYDSPGGVVSGLGEAAETLRASPKPITSFVTGTGASAAYWLASQAGEIVLDRSGRVGSIGGVASMSQQESADANGRRSYEIVSSGAPKKRPDPSTEEGRAAIQSEIDAIEDVFVADVAAGRGVSAARVRADFGQGAMVDAAAAVAVGMADRIGTLEGELKKDPGKTRARGAGSRARASADFEIGRAHV